MFDGKTKLYFDWIQKPENIAAMTKCNPKELALGKAQGAVIKCQKPLPDDVSKHYFETTVFFGSNCNSAATSLMHRYQKKGDNSILKTSFSETSFK